MKPRIHRFIAIAAAFVGFSLPAFSASGTSNTTTSGALWTLNTNWVGNVIADGSGNTAQLSAFLARHGDAAAEDQCGAITWNHSYPVSTVLANIMRVLIKSFAPYFKGSAPRMRKCENWNYCI